MATKKYQLPSFSPSMGLKAALRLAEGIGYPIDLARREPKPDPMADAIPLILSLIDTVRKMKAWAIETDLESALKLMHAIEASPGLPQFASRPQLHSWLEGRVADLRKEQASWQAIDSSLDGAIAPLVELEGQEPEGILPFRVL